MQTLDLAADPGPSHIGLRLDDADEEQSEPAQHHVGADAFPESVVSGPQVDDLLSLPPAPFDLQQLLAAQGDVLGAQVRVGAAQQALAVQVASVLTLSRSAASGLWEMTNRSVSLIRTSLTRMFCPICLWRTCRDRAALTSGDPELSFSPML